MLSNVRKYVKPKPISHQNQKLTTGKKVPPAHAQGLLDLILWLSDPTNHIFEAGWAPQPRDILGGRKVGIVIPIWIFGGMAKLRLRQAARLQASVRASAQAARVHMRSSLSTQPGHRLEAFAPKKHPVFSLFYNIKKAGL